MSEIKRILCPVDFSDDSRHALDHAVAIARWYDSTIRLLHVCTAVPVAAYAPGTPNPSVDRPHTGGSRRTACVDEAFCRRRGRGRPVAATGDH